MNNILHDSTPSALIQAIEANAIESFETWTEWDKMEIHHDPEATWTAADIPYFLFNMVLGLTPQPRDTGPEPSRVIAATISRGSSRQVPLGWWVGPNNPISDLGHLLEEQGWFHAATLTGMAVDLLSLNELESKLPDFTISQVDDADALETWCRIMTSVSEFPDFAADAWWEMYRDIEIIDHHQWRLYIGSI